MPIRIVSDDLSEMIGTQTLESMQRIDENRVQAALARAELRDAVEEKRSEAEKELSKIRIEMEQNAARRLMHAFPELAYDSESYDSIMKELREEIRKESGDKSRNTDRDRQ